VTLTFRDVLVPEFDQEMALTRLVLERVPEEAFDWRPHEQARALGGLAAHLALIPHWGAAILDSDGYDLARRRSDPLPPKMSRAELLAVFDRHVAEVRRGLTDRTDAELAAPWVLTQGRRVLMSMPRVQAIRRFLLDHTVHHRGQMTVYLRMRDVALPPFYGPPANETP
jgi:uncharacterized damage-inducible protein DinB